MPSIGQKLAINQTFRRVIEITGDLSSGEVESCRIHLTDRPFLPTQKYAFSDRIKIEADKDGIALSLLIIGRVHPRDIVDVIRELKLSRAMGNFVMSAMPFALTWE